MAGVRSFLNLYSTRLSLSGWRGVPWLGIVVAITVALPQARALMAAGISGGVVIGAALIIARHRFGSSGPRRGTPVVLFPRPISSSPTGA